VGPDLARGVADFRRTARPTSPPEPAELPEGHPVDPYDARSTDYEEGGVVLTDVNADECTDADDLEPSLT
jgi:hypothetical protein